MENRESKGCESKVYEYGRITRNTEISDGIFDMELETSISDCSKAGQFVMVYVNSESHILPRPISICEINKEVGTIRLIYQVVGEGTRMLSCETAGNRVRLLGALGNGFDKSMVEKGSKIGVIGGGIGSPPMLQLSKELLLTGHDIEIFLGFRTTPILLDSFGSLNVPVHVATDDGNVGFKGNVVELLKSRPKLKLLYSCGPKIMLKSLSLYAKDAGIPCQVSVEERMACGLGACVGCAVHVNGQILKVCKDGPVFDGSEVVWDE